MSKTAYEKAASGEWVDSADLAKLVRNALKKAFRGIKFSVRSKGCGISVRWQDGPPAEEVRGIADDYRTAGFDGSIDLAYSYSLWLYADGSASVAHSEGTVGSNGYAPEIIGSSLRADGVLCTQVSRVYISCYRDLSRASYERGYERAVNRYDLPPHSIEYRESGFVCQPDVWVESHRTWLSCIFLRESEKAADEQWFAANKRWWLVES